MNAFVRTFFRSWIVVYGGLFCIFAFGIATAFAAPQINNQINYQARLMDASGFPVADGNYSIIFSLYDQSSTGTRLWTASGTVGTPTALTINVQNGLFTILLGDTSAAGGSQNTLDTVNWNSDQLFLGVTINADSEMAPRKRFASAPQAFNARQLQGMYASSTASGGQTLFTVNQTEANSATGTRTALDVRTNGTSNTNDLLIRGLDDTNTTVFSVNRQGNATTSFLNATSIFASMVTSTNLQVNIASFATATISGQGICLSDGSFCSGGGGTEFDTLQTVTARGSFTTTTSQFFGGFVAASSSVTGTLAVVGDTYVSGNVGIGTTSPSLKLQIESGQVGLPDGTSTAPALVFNNSTTTGLYYTSNDGGAIGITLGGVQMGMLGFAPVVSTNGQGNLYLGYHNGEDNTLGYNNTAVGNESGINLTTGAQNAYFGSRSGHDNLTGDQNTWLGQGAGYTNLLSAGTGVGFHAGLNTLGGNNTFMGHQAGEGTIGGVAVGSENTAVGDLSMRNFTSASDNAALGRQTLTSLTSGNGNVAVGSAAGILVTTGGGNVLVGYRSGYTETPANALTTGDNNTFIGYQSGQTSPNQLTNAIAIGYRALVQTSNSMVLGGTGANAVNVGIGTTSPSSTLDVQGTVSSTGLLFRNATGTNATTTNLFATSLGFSTATGTSLNTNTAAFGVATISGQSVCLANGTNCPSSGGGTDLNWTYDFAGDFVRNATATTDIAIGSSTLANSPFVFLNNTTTSRFLIGQNSSTGAGADLVIGATTATGMNTLFQLTGDDLFVSGNIGSASSVYTNGAFIAGSGSTYFGNGYINKNDGNLVITASGGFILPATDNSVSLGSPTARYHGVFGNTTSTNSTSTNLFSTNVFFTNSTGTSASSTNLFARNALFTGATTTNLAVTGAFSATNLAWTSATGTFLTVTTSTISYIDARAVSSTDYSSPGNVARFISTATTTGSVRNIYVSGRYLYASQPANALVSIIDIADPLYPKQVSVISTGGGGSGGVYVAGKYLYTATQGALLQIYDIGNPSAPTLVGTLSNVLCEDCTVSGHYLYSVDSDSFDIVDISDPTNPRLTATVATSTGTHIRLQGTLAFISLGGTNKTDIYDVSNPSSPRVLAQITGSTSQGLAVSGRYLYLSSNTDLRIYDISNPSLPVLYSTLSMGNGIQDLFIANNLLYAAAATSLRIVDVTSSTNPRIILNNTLVSPSAIFVAGRYAYAGINNGVRILDMGGADLPNARIGSLEVGNIVSYMDVDIGGTLNVRSGLNVGTLGLYSIGSLAVGSTNTTSTFTYAVSSTRGEFSTGLSVGGVNVCLANGTNCQVASSTDLNWTFNLAGDFVRNATVTTDVIMGSSTAAGAPFVFLNNTTTSRFLIGQNPTAGAGADLVIGATTATGMNSLFQLTGDDLYVQGNIGSASSVYTNGAFIAGSGSTYFGNGYINKNDGNLVITASGGFITPSADLAVSLGSVLLRYNGYFGNTTSTNATSTSSFVSSLGFTTATGSSFNANSASFGIATISGQSVCLVDGTNCQAGGGSLDSAYDFGGSGAGRSITADNGAVEITVPSGGNSPGLVVTNNFDNFSYAGQFFTTGTNTGLLVQNTGYNSPTLATFSAPNTNNNATVEITARDTSLTLQASPSTAGNSVSITAQSTTGTARDLFIGTKSLTFRVAPSNGDGTASFSSFSMPQDGGVIISASSSAANNALEVQNFGTGYSLAVYDNGNPVTDLTPFVIDQDGNMFVGTTTDAGILNAGFSLDGNDAVFAGNIGSVSSVYTNGAFIAGPGSTLYGDGYINKDNGVLTVEASSHLILTSTGGGKVFVTAPGSTVSLGGSQSAVTFDGSIISSLLFYNNNIDNIGSAVSSVRNIYASGTIHAVTGVMSNINASTLFSTAASATTFQATSATIATLNSGAGNIDTLTVFGNASVNGDTFLGNNSGVDRTIFTSTIDSSMNPTTNDAYSLGQASQAWRGFFSSVTSTNILTANFRVTTGQAAFDGGLVSSGLAAFGFMTASTIDSTNGIFGNILIGAATGTTNFAATIGYASSATFGGLCIDDTTSGPNCPTEVNGASIVADGAILANAFDIAEFYTVTGTSEAGDVLVLDASSTATVMRSTGIAYDPKVIGIVSTAPGFVLGWSGGAKVALTGRVPTKVSMNNGSIRVGDALVSSDVPGHAMKATQPGMVLGYALQDASATGTAEVFVSVGFWAGLAFGPDGSVQIDNDGNVSILNDLHVGGRFYPSLKGGGLQNDWYLFVDNTDPSSSRMSTNADGWQSMDTYDFAERYYSPDELEPGDLVIVSDSGRTHVQRSMNEDQMLLGIVSTRPAFIAGRPATSTYPIALSGRVPTKVSNMNGAIKAGDPLAPTSIPGVAAKAIHTGPIVGLALENFESANIGKIEVFVNPGWWTNEAETNQETVINQTVASDAGITRRGVGMITAGSKRVHISFDSIGGYPFVQVTPRGLIQGNWGTDAYSDLGFDIVMSQEQTFDAYFSWQVEPLQESDRLNMSDGTTADMDPVTGLPLGFTTPTTTKEIIPTESDPETTSSTSVSVPTESIVPTSTTEVAPEEEIATSTTP